MNIETSKIKKNQDVQVQNIQTSKQNNEESSVKFTDELKNVAKNEETNKKDLPEHINNINSNEIFNKPQELHNRINIEHLSQNKEVKEELIIRDNKPNKKDLFEKSNLETETKIEMEIETETEKQTLNLDSALDSMNAILKEFNQSDDKNIDKIKEKESLADKNIMINNDFNIQENKDLMPQMNPNMNFSGDGQPFSSFMNDEKDQKKNNNRILGTNAQDLAEEAAILSTMSENIAIANKNQLVNETKIVVSNEGVKKVDTKTNIKIEDIVKYDSIIMNQADVEVFANIVEKGEIDVKDLTTKGVEKSVQISKTLADLLAKAMNDNQPIRINFDNNISVIIRISREGKLTADFLPSSQVAEAYLKENLPLLKQRFDDNNIDYDSLNQRERKEQNRENNKKKGRNNE